MSIEIPHTRAARTRACRNVAFALIAVAPLAALSAAEIPDITKAINWAKDSSTDAKAIVSDICAKVTAAPTSRAVDQERINVAKRKADGKHLLGSLRKTIKDMAHESERLKKAIELQTKSITAKVDADLENITKELEARKAKYDEKKSESAAVDKQVNKLAEFLDGKGAGAGLTLRELAEKVVENDDYISNHWNSAAPEYSQNERDRKNNLAGIKSKLEALKNEGLQVPNPNLFELDTRGFRARLPRGPVQNLIGQLEKERSRIEDLQLTYSQDPILQEYANLQGKQKSKTKERKALLDNDEKLNTLKKQQEKHKQETDEQRLEAQTQVSELTDRIEALDRASKGIRACVEGKLKTLMVEKQRLLAKKQSEYDSIQKRFAQRKEALVKKIRTVMEEFREKQKIVRCPALRKVLLARANKLKENLGSIPRGDVEAIKNEWKHAGCWFEPDKKAAAIKRWREEYNRNVKAKKERVLKQAKELWLKIRHEASRDMLKNVIHPLSPELPKDEDDYDEIDREIKTLIEGARDDIRKWLKLGRDASAVDIDKMILPFRPWQGLAFEAAPVEQPVTWKVKLDSVVLRVKEGSKSEWKETKLGAQASGSIPVIFDEKRESSFGTILTLQGKGTFRYHLPERSDNRRKTQLYEASLEVTFTTTGWRADSENTASLALSDPYAGYYSGGHQSGTKELIGNTSWTKRLTLATDISTKRATDEEKARGTGSNIWQAWLKWYVWAGRVSFSAHRDYELHFYYEEVPVDQ